jgi:hypothetical protein
MMPVLGFRLGRRLVAVVAAGDEIVAFHDCHYVSSRPATRTAGLSRYFDRLLSQWTPTLVAIYAPTTPETPTEQLVDLLRASATRLHVPVVRLGRSDLLSAASLAPVRTREELGQQVTGLWEALPVESRPKRLPLAEAFTAALLGELQLALSARAP